MSCLHVRAPLALGVSLPLPTEADALASGAPPPGRPAAEIGLDTISVSATKSGAAAVDTLAGTRVVTRGQIDRLRPGGLSEVLRDEPGVTTQENRDDPAQAIDIRIGTRGTEWLRARSQRRGRLRRAR